MTKIIGHRGVAGIMFENTLASFAMAEEIGVDAIEFDVQRTRDGKLVVCHDDELFRLTKTHAVIHTKTYDELTRIPLRNGDRIPLLSEVLEAIKHTPVIVEIKIRKHTKEVIDLVDQYPHLRATFVSDITSVVTECRKLSPNAVVLLVERHDPFSILTKVKTTRASGLDLNRWLINPFTYLYAKHKGMPIMVYTVNSRVMFWFLSTFYPDVWICTNNPQRFVPDQPLRPDTVQHKPDPTSARHT